MDTYYLVCEETKFLREGSGPLGHAIPTFPPPLLTGVGVTVTEVVEGEGAGVVICVSTGAGVLVGTLSEVEAASVEEATREEEALAAHRLELWRLALAERFFFAISPWLRPKERATW